MFAADDGARHWRRRRKLTQAVFADRIGRSKSWVEKVERGERSAGRLSVLDGICQVLQLDVAALIGTEPAHTAQPCLDDSEVEHIRSSLERYHFDSGGDQAPDLVSLRGQLGHAWAAFEFADYQVMGRVLPDLLDEAQGAHAMLDSDESAAVLAEVYQVIASTLRKLGEHTLAWLAGDRAVVIAQQAGNLAGSLACLSPGLCGLGCWAGRH
jgi:transcriptional regulator with XRE-family HTH domain